MDFFVQYNVGKSRYVVNHHDGRKTHSDGSPFYDVTIFSSKRKLDSFVKELRGRGYAEDHATIHRGRNDS